MELKVPSLISLWKVFYFCWHTQSSGLDVFVTQLDVNVSFPCSATAFSPLLPPCVTPLWSTTCIYLFPTFWLYGKKSSHRATGRRIRAENCLLFGKEHKNGLKAPQAHKVVSSTSHLPSPAAAGASQRGRGSSLLPLPRNN